MQYTSVLSFSAEDVPRVSRVLSSLEEKPTVESFIFRRFQSDSGVITVYRSGKVLIQGKDKSWTDKMSELLQKPGPERLMNPAPHRVDEAGKGDFFGRSLSERCMLNRLNRLRVEEGQSVIRKELSDSTVNEVACRMQSVPVPYRYRASAR